MLVSMLPVSANAEKISVRVDVPDGTPANLDIDV
jgi:hypothetical protein